MRSPFHPFLPNGPWGDPVVWIDLPDEGQSVLLDLGDLHRIPNRKLLRVGRVLVSHTHMDHFVGFDHLLRLALVRERELVLTGPPGFLHQVRSRIESYSWNVIESYPIRLRVEEVHEASIHAATYTGAGRLRPQEESPRDRAGALYATRAYTLDVDLFDHGIPVLGAALSQPVELSVNKDRLVRLGLTPGPWLAKLKLAVRRGRAANSIVEAEGADGGTQQHPLGRLANAILSTRPGPRLAYLTDLRATEANLQRAATLAHQADLLICEATFLDRDAELARERNHLTARQAGELARRAGARRLAPFHFSPRYQGREQELVAEAAAAFGGPVVELPTGPMASDIVPFLSPDPTTEES